MQLEYKGTPYHKWMINYLVSCWGLPAERNELIVANQNTDGIKYRGGCMHNILSA